MSILNYQKNGFNFLKQRNRRYWTRLIDRENENSIKPISDDGATLLASYRALERFKVCEEEYHLFDELYINDFPKPQAYINGFQNNIISSYRWIQHPTIYSLKYIPAEMKRPIVFGIAVYSNFEELNKDHYVLHPPSEKDQYLGMHGLVIIGYTEKP